MSHHHQFDTLFVNYHSSFFVFLLTVHPKCINLIHPTGRAFDRKEKGRKIVCN